MVPDDSIVLVIANRRDQTAKRLVERLSSLNACLLTPADLSVAGWRYRVDDIDSCIAVVNGRKVTSRAICGVIIRMPCVLEEDLGHIIPSDRAYVAAEMSAFLLSWLTSFKCPVLNRPTPRSLSGPNWPYEKWAYTAAQLGIPVVASSRRVVFPPVSRAVENHRTAGVAVTVVGKRCPGTEDEALAKRTLLIAQAAGVDFLTVWFTGPGPESLFLGASLCPDTITDDVACALIEYFQDAGVKET